MSILSGYGKFKRYVLTSTGYKLCSQWTSSNTVHFDDGNTAQTKLGAISGISDSLTSTSSNIALSVKSGKSLQDQITSLNTSLTGKANSSHTHTKSQITDFPTSLPASDVYSWAKAASKPSYSWSEITGKPSTFTPASHTHDDRYYTESEINTLLGGYVTTADDAYWKRISGFAKYYNSNNANVTSAGAAYLIPLATASDERVKDNIVATKVKALDIINLIQHKSYDYKYSEFGSHTDIGYIAQELITLVPEAVISVSQDKEKFGYDKLYQINYTALIPYLTKAVQELSEKVDTLLGPNNI